MGKIWRAPTRQLSWAAGLLGLASTALVAWAVQRQIDKVGQRPPWESWLVFAMGGLVALLVAVMLVQQGQVHDHAEREAHRPAADLPHMALGAGKTFDAVVMTDADCPHHLGPCRLRAHHWVGAGEVLGRRPGERLRAPQTVAGTMAPSRDALNASQTFNGQPLNQCWAGTLHWAELDPQPLFGVHGTLDGFFAVQRDVTAARDAALRLATQRKRLQRIIWATQAGTWERDLVSGEDVISPGCSEMRGHTIEELLTPVLRSFMECVHADDASGFEKARDAHLHGLTRQYHAEFGGQHK